MVDFAGGVNRTQGTRLNQLDPLANGDQGIQGMSLKQLMEELSKYMQGQGGPQNAQGGGQPSGGGAPQAAGGPQQAGAGNDSMFSLEELLKEMQRRQEQAGEREFANQMRAVNRAQPGSGGQNQPSLANQLLAFAPPDVGQNLNIGSGGGFTGGGAFA